jgi:hypothetical protein
MADVLYVVLGSVAPTRREIIVLDVELGFGSDGSPCGVTVTKYRRNGWQSRLGELTKIASVHLATDPAAIMRSIRAAVK